METGAKIVSKAIAEMDFVVVVIGGKSYTIHPPTIKRIAGAYAYVSDMKNAETVADVLRGIGRAEDLTKALSWMIQGDESICDELSNATFDEIVESLEIAYSLISVENFTRLSTLLKNVGRMIANQK